MAVPASTTRRGKQGKHKLVVTIVEPDWRYELLACLHVQSDVTPPSCGHIKHKFVITRSELKEESTRIVTLFGGYLPLIRSALYVLDLEFLANVVLDEQDAFARLGL